MPEYDMPRPRFRADDPDQEKQMRKIISWLLQQDEKIRYILNNLDEDNFSEGLTTQISEALNIATTVNGTAQKEEIDALTGRVRRAETAISQNETEIRAKASQSEVDGLEERMGEAEAKITPTQIVATVRGSTEYQNDQHEFETEYSEIELTKDKAKITTPEFVVNIIKEGETETSLQIDEDGAQMEYLSVEKMIKAPNMAEKYMGAANLTVGTGGNYATLQAAFNTLNNKILTDDVTITLLSDLTEIAELKGIMGSGKLSIDGGSHTLTGSVALKYCKCAIEAEDLTIEGSSPGLSVTGCDYVNISDCVIDGGDANLDLSISEGSRVMLYNVELYNAVTLIQLTNMSDLRAIDCLGGDSNATYLYASDSTWAWFGDRPVGGYLEEGPCIYKDDSTGTNPGTPPSPPLQPTVLKTENITATLTGNWYGSWNKSEQLLRQGRYDSTDYTGAMWFPLGNRSGTVTRAAVTLTRRSRTGRSGTVDVMLYKLSNQGKSGEPVLTGGELLGSIASGERKSFDIPTSYVTLGGLTGLAIQADDTDTMSGRSYSENYAAFDGTDGDAPVLTVQYETT